MAYFALFYHVVDGFVERRLPFREAHLAHASSAAKRGELALGGALAEPPDVVVVGHDLPEISSADVLLTLRTDPRARSTALVEWDPLCSAIQLVATIVNALEGLHEHHHSSPAMARAPLPEPFAALV